MNITIDSATGLIRVRGIPLCQRVRTKEGIKLLVEDKANCKRTKLRGHRGVEVTWEEFVSAVTGLSKPEEDAR